MENENPTPTPEKKGGKLKILIVLLVVVVVAGGAVLFAGGDFFQGFMKSKEKTEETVKEVDTIKKEKKTAVSLQKDIDLIKSYVSSDTEKAIDDLKVLKKVLEEESDKKAFSKVAELERLVEEFRKYPELEKKIEIKFDEFKIEEEDLTKKVVSNDVVFVEDLEEFTTKYSQITEDDAANLVFAAEIESTRNMKHFSFFLPPYAESPFSDEDVKVMTGFSDGTYKETSFTVDNGVVKVSDINGMPAFITVVGRDNFVDANKVFEKAIFIDSLDTQDEQMFFNIKKSY